MDDRFVTMDDRFVTRRRRSAQRDSLDSLEDSLEDRASGGLSSDSLDEADLRDSLDYIFPIRHPQYSFEQDSFTPIATSTERRRRRSSSDSLEHSGRSRTRSRGSLFMSSSDEDSLEPPRSRDSLEPRRSRGSFRPRETDPVLQSNLSRLGRRRRSSASSHPDSSRRKRSRTADSLDSSSTSMSDDSLRGSKRSKMKDSLQDPSVEMLRGNLDLSPPVNLGMFRTSSSSSGSSSTSSGRKSSRRAQRTPPTRRGTYGRTSPKRRGTFSPARRGTFRGSARQRGGPSPSRQPPEVIFTAPTQERKLASVAKTFFLWDTPGFTAAALEATKGAMSMPVFVLVPKTGRYQGQALVVSTSGRLSVEEKMTLARRRLSAHFQKGLRWVSASIRAGREVILHAGAASRAR